VSVAALFYAAGMCRNIHTLHNFDPPATDEEVRDAALQYVRKISGSTKPSQANAESFERAAARLARDDGAVEEPRGRGGKAPRPRRRALRCGRLISTSAGRVSEAEAP
jgi:hypothetical protein